MAQSTNKLTTAPLAKGACKTRGGFTVAQYATAALVAGTVMGQKTADDELLPITNVAATDGTKFPSSS